MAKYMCNMIKVTAWEIEIDRIVDGKIAEVWARYDALGIMQQLGLIPTSAWS